MRLAVVGHVEWVEFVRVEHVPAQGEIVNASDAFEEAAGGGAVAAIQLVRLAGEADFFTALGNDQLADRSRERLEGLGARVVSASRDQPTRRALTLVDDAGERTIITIGSRLQPELGDGIDWEALSGTDGVYFTAGDADALRAARRARVLVATPRAGEVLHEAGVELDALVYSENDVVESKAARELTPSPALMVATRGAAGGSYTTAAGETGSWEPVAPPGPVIDAYGSGDSFAAALTYGLAAGAEPREALQLAARAGATCLTGRGPYGRQLTSADSVPFGR